MKIQRNILPINTTKGLFQYERLPFGISSAPATFQRTMKVWLPGVVVYIDDILVTGQNKVDRMNKVLDRLENAGVTLKKQNVHLQHNQLSTS